jgi:hypothetical protein
MRIVGVLDADGPALLERVVDLRANLVIGEIGKKGKVPWVMRMATPSATVAVGTKSAVSVD